MRQSGIRAGDSAPRACDFRCSQFLSKAMRMIFWLRRHAKASMTRRSSAPDAPALMSALSIASDQHCRVASAISRAYSRDFRLISLLSDSHDAAGIRLRRESRRRLKSHSTAIRRLSKSRDSARRCRDAGVCRPAADGRDVVYFAPSLRDFSPPAALSIGDSLKISPQLGRALAIRPRGHAGPP